MFKDQWFEKLREKYEKMQKVVLKNSEEEINQDLEEKLRELCGEVREVI